MIDRELALKILKKEKDADLLTATLIALAKLGVPPAGDAPPDLVEVLSEFLDHGNHEVAEAAAVALGVLGDRRAAPLLADLLHGTRAGAKAVGSSKVPRRLRAYAGYFSRLAWLSDVFVSGLLFVALVSLPQMHRSTGLTRPEDWRLLSLGLVATLTWPLTLSLLGLYGSQRRNSLLAETLSQGPSSP